jgi:hypothetical protein
MTEPAEQVQGSEDALSHPATCIEREIWDANALQEPLDERKWPDDFRGFGIHVDW